MFITLRIIYFLEKQFVKNNNLHTSNILFPKNWECHKDIFSVQTHHAETFHTKAMARGEETDLALKRILNYEGNPTPTP